ncbi:tetratricopeptide repeat protein [Geobacter sp.]|uniref:tetratricopeptide repeat protein n=1 Tax=Geobacter sp. TaxID=46610 RepID=UPI001ACEB0BC|nr:tetratricopeptide repeat protein [Geobacter sp.]CAG0981381.1 hypothetical protein ANRL4_01895 [Anaerolineae bacterium]
MRKCFFVSAFLISAFVIVFSSSSFARTNPNTHMDQGIQAMSKGDFKTAVGEFKGAIWYFIEEKVQKNWPFEPNDHERGSMCYLYRGMSYLRLQNTQLALEDFKSAEKWSDGMPDVQMNIATEYYKLGRHDDAIRLYGKVLEKQPERGLAHYFIGFPYMKKKDYERAWFHALKAKELGVNQTGLINKLEAVAPKRQTK